jgi:DNA-binding MarR family transcriptional regulator
MIREADVTDPERVSAQKLSAWVAFMYAHARVMRRLSNDLDEAGEISMATYDVLVQLSEAGGSLRHRDLLDRLVVSQPGLSRKVERLESMGLVERHPDPADGRGVIVKLSRSGRAALRSAAKVHMAGISREFGALMSDQEAQVLQEVFGRMLNSLTASGRN